MQNNTSMQTTGESGSLQYAGFDTEKYQQRIDQLSSMETLNKEQVIEVLTLKAAIAWEIPASGITILGGKPYANTAGLLYKVHSVAKSQDTKIKRIVAEPMKDGEGKPIIATKVGDTAMFKGIVEFEDGRSFEDIGEANPSNIAMSTIRPFANSMASRRATNRAMRLAAQFGLTSYEEVAESESTNEGQPSDEQPLTEKDMTEIVDDVASVDAVDSKEALEKARTHLSARKAKLNDRQIKYLSRLFARKKMEYGEF